MPRMKKLPFIPNQMSCCMVRTYRKYYWKEPIMDSEPKFWNKQIPLPTHYLPRKLSESEIESLKEDEFGPFVDPVDLKRYSTRSKIIWNHIKKRSTKFP